MEAALLIQASGQQGGTRAHQGECLAFLAKRDQAVNCHVGCGGDIVFADRDRDPGRAQDTDIHRKDLAPLRPDPAHEVIQLIRLRVECPDDKNGLLHSPLPQMAKFSFRQAAQRARASATKRSLRLAPPSS